MPLSYQARYAEIEALSLPQTVPAMLAYGAQHHGAASAVDFFEHGQALSFAELAKTVRKLAHGLYGVGVRKGDHVAVLLPNRLEYPITWLALAELGAVMVPIVSSSTAREIEFFIRDGDVSALIVEAGFLASRGLTAGDACLPSPERTVIVGDPDPGCWSYAALMEAGDEHFVVADPPGPGDLLNIQYTSGTTGLPKGVMLNHQFWVIAGVVPVLMWGEHFATILADAPFYYIDAQWMLIAGLYTGARIDFVEKMSVRKWVDWLVDRETELAWFTDPVLKSPPDPRERQVKAKLFLGYHMSPAMLAEAETRFGVPVREAYGMTEVGMGLAVPMEASDPDLAGTCGAPGPFRRCRIVRPDGEDVDTGEIGELWIGGEGILDGYYNRPEATAESLVSGWFRTGDLFVRDAKGYYRIVGRLKDMIRRSQESISAAEVEQVLTDLPGVVAAAVVPVPDEDRGEEVKAYLKLAPGAAAPSPQAILDHCAERLARFKLPRFIAFVDEFPYTPSEKIAKHVLVRDAGDLRAGAYDAVEGRWLS